MRFSIAVLPGDGVGSEVTGEAVKVLEAVGRRFGHALVTSTLGGRTSFSESFRLLGVKTPAALRDFAASLGIDV